MENNSLSHHGVKGMKWGQHIFGKIKTANTNRKRKKNLAKAREVRAERQKALKSGKLSPKKMTEAELNDRIKRLELEKKYTDLLKGNKQAQQNRGKKFINKFLDASVEKVAENAAADVLAQALKVVTTKGVNKVFGEEVVYTNNKRK